MPPPWPPAPFWKPWIACFIIWLTPVEIMFEPSLRSIAVKPPRLPSSAPEIAEDRSVAKSLVMSIRLSFSEPTLFAQPVQAGILRLLHVLQLPVGGGKLLDLLPLVIVTPCSVSRLMRLLGLAVGILVVAADLEELLLLLQRLQLGANRIAGLQRRAVELLPHLVEFLFRDPASVQLGPQRGHVVLVLLDRRRLRIEASTAAP